MKLHNKEIRLSEKQKEVIKLMREGWRLHWRPIEFYFSKNGKLTKNLHYKEIASATDELCKFDILESVGRNPGAKQHFILTETGKTINID